VIFFSILVIFILFCFFMSIEDKFYFFKHEMPVGFAVLVFLLGSCKIYNSCEVWKENNHLQQVTTQLEKETAKYVPWLFNVEEKDIQHKKSYVVDVLENLGSQDLLDDWYNSNSAKQFVLQKTKVDAKAQRVELTGLEFGAGDASDTEWERLIYVIHFIQQDGRWLIQNILDKRLEENFKRVDELKEPETQEPETQELETQESKSEIKQPAQTGFLTPRELYQSIKDLLGFVSRQRSLFAQNNNTNLGYAMSLDILYLEKSQDLDLKNMALQLSQRAA